MAQPHFSLPRSLKDLSEEISEKLSSSEELVLLTGDSGSGRTCVSEYVVNALDDTFITVFIPCQKESELSRLRTFFLQQVAPADKWDEEKSLAENFALLNIPVRQKILVVIDDVDEVISNFFDEIIKLYEQELGRSRFSFLITSHSLWAQTKISAQLNDKLKFKEYSMPSLSLDEAICICRQMFESVGLKKVYDVIYPNLPKSFAACEGNLGKIIKLTETFMSDPTEVEKETPKSTVNKSHVNKKKGNSTGMLISVVCIIIVLLCLIPVFFGTSIFDKILGNKPEENLPTKIEIRSPDLDENENSRLSFGDEDTQKEGSPRAIPDDTPENRAKWGSADNAVTDEGALPEQVTGGVEAENVKPQTEKSVTLQGEALEAIEGREADAKSEHPRRGLDGSLKNANNEEQSAPNMASVSPAAADSSVQDKQEESAPKNGEENKVREAVLLTRQDSVLYKDRIAKENEVIALREQALKEQREKQQRAAMAASIDEDRKIKEIADSVTPKDEDPVDAKKNTKSESTPAAKPQVTTAQTETNENKTTQITNPLEQSVDSKTNQNKKAKPVSAAARNSESLRTNHRAVSGNSEELYNRDGTHFALQVRAGSDIDDLRRAASYIDGTYYIYKTYRQGRPWYVLITGNFATQREAMAESRKLPESIRAAGPFAKSFERIKTEMRTQQ